MCVFYLDVVVGLDIICLRVHLVCGGLVIGIMYCVCVS